MTDRADLESRVFLAIAKTMPTKQPAAVLEEIERTHILVPRDCTRENGFPDDVLDEFTEAIGAEVEMSGGQMGGSHPHVFAVHAISWLEDAGFRLAYVEPVEPIRQNAATSDTSETPT